MGVSTIRPESIQTISEDQTEQRKFKIAPEQTNEIKREILKNLENSPEEVLNDLGGAALDRVFPEITSDNTKPQDIEKLTKHFVFRDGITVTPSTKTIFIPRQTREEVVKHFLTSKFGEIKNAAENGSLYSMEVAVSPNAIANRFTEEQRKQLDEGEGKDTGDIWAGQAYMKISKDPKAEGAKGPKSGETPSGVSTVEPMPATDPESEPEFYIQPVMREGQFPQITSDESTLSKEYLSRMGKAIIEKTPNKLLEVWNPRLLSPDLIILELKNGKKRLVFAKDSNKNWWHKKMFGSSPEEADDKVIRGTGTRINRWLHDFQTWEGMGRKEFDITSEKSL